MKKIIALLLVASTFVVSCSKTDEAVVDASSGILVKKMVTTRKSKSSGFTDTNTVDFIYNGNKIVSMNSTGSEVYKSKFTYEGDLITKVEDLDDSGVQGRTITYAYNSSGNLKTSVLVFISIPNLQYIKEYTHNSDGTVSYVSTENDTKTNSVTTNGNGKLTYSNGNLIKIEYTSSSNSGVLTYVYEYDTKNNPFKNITGYKKLLDHDELTSLNNVVKSTESFSNPITSYVFPSIFTYNTSNFPTKELQESDSFNTTIEYTY